MNPLISKNTTGHDWKQESLKIRKDFCRFHAEAQSKAGIKINSDILYNSLTEMFDTDEDSVLNVKLNEAIALTVSAAA